MVITYLCDMRNTFLNRPFLIGFPLMVAVLVVLFYISHSAEIFEGTTGIELALTIDFLVVIPTIYFLIIRRTSVPNITVIPVLILSMILCGVALPSNHQFYLDGFEKWIFPCIELGVVSLVFWKMRKVTVNFRANKSNNIDFFTSLKSASAEVLPKSFVAPFATEIAVIYYGFLTWKRRPFAENEFTYHKDSATVALLNVVIFIVAVEMIALHLLIGRWSTTAAWVLTVLSAYSALQLFGFAKGASRRPIVIENGLLKLRYSFLKEAEIPLNQIKDVRIDSKDLNDTEVVGKLSLLHALEGHNVIVELHRPETLHGMYGTKKEFEKIAIHIDDKERFIAMLKQSSLTTF